MIESDGCPGSTKYAVMRSDPRSIVSLSIMSPIEYPHLGGSHAPLYTESSAHYQQAAHTFKAETSYRLAKWSEVQFKFSSHSETLKGSSSISILIQKRLARIIIHVQILNFQQSSFNKFGWSFHDVG